MSKPVGFFKKDGKTRPITKKKKGSDYNGQTGDSSWKDSSIQDLKGKSVRGYFWAFHPANNRKSAKSIAKQLRQTKGTLYKHHAEVIQRGDKFLVLETVTKRVKKRSVKALERWKPKVVKPPLKVGTKWQQTGVDKYDIFNYEVIDPETVLLTKGSYRAYDDISLSLNKAQKKQLHAYRRYKDSETWYNVLVEATKLKKEGQNPDYQEERIRTAKKRIKENRK